MNTYNTKQRTILLDYLTKHPDSSFTVDQLATSLAGNNISRSAIYRNLSSLEIDGKLRRISGGGKISTHYQFIDTNACLDHLHLSCSKCGKTIHMEAPQTERLVNDILSNENFLIDRKNTVLYGLCSSCKKN